LDQFLFISHDQMKELFAQTVVCCQIEYARKLTSLYYLRLPTISDKLELCCQPTVRN